MARDRTLVFSTETDESNPTIRPPPLSATAGSSATEKKGRGGKTVTTVSGLPLEPDALKTLGKKLKKSVSAALSRMGSLRSRATMLKRLWPSYAPKVTTRSAAVVKT